LRKEIAKKLNVCVLDCFLVGYIWNGHHEVASRNIPGKVRDYETLQ